MPENVSRDTQVSDIFFVGREREQQMYERLLTRETPWVMLIAGLPGSGKSELLRQMAKRNEKENIPVINVDFTQNWPRSDILTILERLAQQVHYYCDDTRYQDFDKSLNDGRAKLTPEGKLTKEIDAAYRLQVNAQVQELRDVIDTMGKKVVLILGRFSEGRKPVLDALREKLRTLHYLPTVFDFEPTKQLNFTETVKTIVGLCCFIIADITKPMSVPLELQATVPDYMIPFVPIILEGEIPFSMLKDLQNAYENVLGVRKYKTITELSEFFTSWGGVFRSRALWCMVHQYPFI